MVSWNPAKYGYRHAGRYNLSLWHQRLSLIFEHPEIFRKTSLESFTIERHSMKLHTRHRISNSPKQCGNRSLIRYRSLKDYLGLSSLLQTLKHFVVAAFECFVALVMQDSHHTQDPNMIILGLLTALVYKVSQNIFSNKHVLVVFIGFRLVLIL